MTTRTLILSGVLVAMASGAAGAQMPAPRGPEPSIPAAKLLLSNTGELGLTDQQVVRLAAIARRAEGRRAALRASMDSARTRVAQPGDSAARRQFAQRMRADVERAREQMHADQRDAIAVLTPDQQARAWQMVTTRGRAMRGDRMDGRRGARPGGGRAGPGRGRGAPGFDGARPMRQGPEARPNIGPRRAPLAHPGPSAPPPDSQ